MKTITKKFILLLAVFCLTVCDTNAQSHRDTGITIRTDVHLTYDTGNVAYQNKSVINYCPDADSVYFTWYGGDTLYMWGVSLLYHIDWTAGPFYTPSHKAAIPVSDFNWGDTVYLYELNRHPNSPWYTKIYPQPLSPFKPTDVNYTVSPISGIIYCNQRALIAVHISSFWNADDSIVWSYGGRGVHDTISDTTFASWRQTYKIHLFLTSDSGCYAIDSTSKIFARNLPNGKVCWATVDTTNTHNIIVWDTAGLSNQGIDSLRLYYYNIGWHLIGEESISVSDTSRYFVDATNVGANGPGAKSETYMILSVDSCGDVEDTTIGTTGQNGYFNSSSHTTMNITMSPAGTFNWGSAPYEIGGSSPSAEYYLFRNDSIVDSASGVQQFTDLHYNPTAKYYVGIKFLSYDMCPVTARALGHRAQTNSPALLSHSNILVNGVSASIASINDKNSFKVYPNPSNGAFNIEANTKSIIKIYNVVGEELFTGSLNGGENVINLARHSPGIYLYHIVSENGEILYNGKLVIE